MGLGLNIFIWLWNLACAPSVSRTHTHTVHTHSPPLLLSLILPLRAFISHIQYDYISQYHDKVWSMQLRLLGKGKTKKRYFVNTYRRRDLHIAIQILTSDWSVFYRKFSLEGHNKNLYNNINQPLCVSRLELKLLGENKLIDCCFSSGLCLFDGLIGRTTPIPPLHSEMPARSRMRNNTRNWIWVWAHVSLPIKSNVRFGSSSTNTSQWKRSSLVKIR